MLIGHTMSIQKVYEKHRRSIYEAYKKHRIVFLSRTKILIFAARLTGVWSRSSMDRIEVS